MTTYAELAEAEQVEVLRPAAVEASAAFGLEVERMEVAAHAYNTTFRVETADGETVALRVGTGSKSTPAHVVAQQSWLEAIAAETPVRVPVPRRTSTGGWYAEAHLPAYGDRPLLVTAASWLPGPDLTSLEVPVARALGRATAHLHRQAEHWTPPPGGELPRLDTPLFGDEDRLDTVSWIDDDERDALERTREVTGRLFERLHDGAPVRPLHADLHRGNLKWDPDGGGLAVFDLDDCGYGVPLLDLAIATFYLREGEETRARAVEEALRAGYAEVAPLPDHDPADLEGLMAARQLLLANDMLSSTTAEFRAMAADYLPTSARRLRRWLDTGRFSRET